MEALRLTSQWLPHPSPLRAIAFAVSAVALGACGNPLAPNRELSVELFASLVGEGRIHAPDSQVPLDCRWEAGAPAQECAASFFDAGAWGVIDVLATADAGWVFDSWSDDCATFTSSTCTLSFATTPAIFFFTATFVPVPDAIVLSDDFDSDCDDWSTTSNTSGVPGTSNQQCRPNGGSDGGGYYEMTHVLPGEGSIVADHQYVGATVLAGSGGAGATCIATVRFAEQRVISSPAYAGAAVGSSVWIIQDGVRYRASLGQFTDTGWTAWDSGPLTAADFTPAGLDLCPAVSTPLAFGFARSNTNSNASATQANVHAIDEWSVTLQPGS